MRILLLLGAILLAPLASAGLIVSSPGDGDTVGPDFVVEGRFEETPETAFAATPGFLGLWGGALLFERDAPPEAWSWGLPVQEHVRLERPIIQYDEVHDLGDAASLPPGQAAGIQPGAHILMSRPDGTYGCTANYIWRDNDNQKLYLGAAGHCFLPEDKTATHGSGADYDPSKTSVRVCVADCQYGGQLGFIFTGTLEELGPVAYARQTGGGGDVGNDFGIVEIPEDLWDLVDPAMAVWGGPTGSADGLSFGTRVVHFGNAAGLGEHFTTQARSGVGGGSDSDSWIASTPSNSGDSGSAVNTAVLDGADLVGDEAVGVLTHLSVSLQAGFVAGTTMPRSIAMTRQADIGIEPVLDGEDVPGFSGGVPAAPVDVRATPGDGTVGLSWAPAEGPEPSSYVVRFGEVPGGPYSSAAPTEETSLVVEGLANGATYYFVVHAVGEGGESPPSAEVSARPAAGEATPGAPRGLAALAAEGAVDLTWDPPADDGGSPIVGYTVRWTTEDAGAYRHSMRVTGTDATVAGLAPDEEHYFVVHARNDAGEGPASNEARAVPFAPAVPERVVEIRLGSGAWERAEEWDGERFRHTVRGAASGEHVLEVQVVEQGQPVDSLRLGLRVASEAVAGAEGGKASPGPAPMVALALALGTAWMVRRRR